MEKYNTIVKIEEIKRLTENGETERAVKAADSVDVLRLRTVSDMSIVGEAYIRGREYEKARAVYEKLFEKSHSRRVVMQLVNLSVKLKDVEAAEEYLQDFMDIAPDDFYRFIFRYSIDKLRGEPYEVLIDSLERLKKKEYIEKWAYELAKLYHKAGMDQKCVDECSDIILWFGDGQYVERAKALRSYYYGELDLGWLEESKLMETRPIPPLNLTPPKEPIPFKKPAIPEPSKDERFERKMTGGYISPIGTARSAAGVSGSPRTNPEGAEDQEPLPVIQTDGLFDEADPIEMPEEPEEQKWQEHRTGRPRDLAEREQLFKAVPVRSESAGQSESESRNEFGNEKEAEGNDPYEYETDYADEAETGNCYEAEVGIETGTVNQYEDEAEAGIETGAVNQYEDEAGTGYEADRIYREEAAAAREPEREWGRETLAEEIKRKEREEREKTGSAQRGKARLLADRKAEDPEGQAAGMYPEQVKAEEEVSAVNGPEERLSSGKVLEFPSDRESSALEAGKDGLVSQGVSVQIEIFRDSLNEQGLSFETLFGIYSRIPGMEGELAKMLEDTVTGEAVQYNYRIVGEKSTGKTALAKNISKYLYKTGCITTPKVALITAEKLNRINLIQKKEALADCCLIVEGAGGLNTSAAAGLAHVIRAFNGRLAVILEDTKENMDKLEKEREPLMRLFKPAVGLPDYTVAELAEFVSGFLAEKGFHLLPGAKEVLIARLEEKSGQEGETINLELAKRVAETAIERAERRNQAELLKFAESGELGKADLEGITAEDF